MADIKNQVIVLLDTANKESIIQIGKTAASPPSSQEELNRIVLLDIATLAEALVVTIRAAHQMGVQDESVSMQKVMDHMHEAFVDPNLQCESRIEKILGS